MSDYALVVQNIFRDAISPPPKQSVVEWLEDNIYMPPRATPIAGKYSCDITPYAKKILEDYNDPSIIHLDMCFSAQSSKTTIMLMMFYYSMGNNPSNSIWMTPSTNLSQSFSETRFTPIIDASPVLLEMKPTDRSLYKKMEMHFAEFTHNFIGGNSASQLAMRSAGKLFLDEIDKLPLNLNKEADPVSLIEERSKWFKDRKIVKSSTPTGEDGRIWIAYLNGSQEQYNVKCPCCKEDFYPTWKMVKWDKQEDLSIAEKAATGFLQCPNTKCDFAIQEKHKTSMLADGEWVVNNPEHPPDTRSYHFTEILSPMTRLTELVEKFLKAEEKAKKGDITALQNFINSSLGEPWFDDYGKYKRVNEDIEKCMDGRDRGMVPDGAFALVAGVDTQDDGFYYVVRAFGEHMTSWLVDYGFVADLDAIEETLWGNGYKDRHGEEYLVDFALIDSQGHRTDEIYAWCRDKPPSQIMPAVGRRTLNKKFIHVDINKQSFGGFRRVVTNTTYYKNMLARKIGVSYGSVGAFYVFDDVCVDYKKQMCAEFLNDVGVWVCPSHKANHLWDCEYMSFVAADMMGIWENQDIEEQQQEVELEEDEYETNRLW